jgi:hypothetical protein
MDEDLHHLAQQYAHTRGIKLRERLGFGIHGIVFSAEDNAKPGEKRAGSEQLTIVNVCRRVPPSRGYGATSESLNR